MSPGRALGGILELRLETHIRRQAREAGRALARYHRVLETGPRAYERPAFTWYDVIHRDAEASASSWACVVLVFRPFAWIRWFWR